MFKKFLLIMGLSLITNLSFSHVQNEGDNVIIIKSNCENLEEKTDYSSSISASIEGHALTIVFTENLGQVVVDVLFAGGGEVDTRSLYTPSGVFIYIPNTGNYIVTFTLQNGDEYYGEFEVTE